MQIITDILNKICIRCNNKKVGVDSYGNEYYQNAKTKKRFVVYQGKPEASKVVANWHSWLHYTTNELRITNQLTYSWQINHQPNLTGTADAYHPKLTAKTNSAPNFWQPK
jgi:NADH:ubiquinone oxidoreductase subunit